MAYFYLPIPKIANYILTFNALKLSLCHTKLQNQLNQNLVNSSQQWELCSSHRMLVLITSSFLIWSDFTNWQFALTVRRSTIKQKANLFWRPTKERVLLQHDVNETTVSITKKLDETNRNLMRWQCVRTTYEHSSFLLKVRYVCMFYNF